MNLHFLKNCLHHIDRKDSDTLVLSIFSNERPLKGLNGLADWRINGRISGWILSGRYEGKLRESLLFPAGIRLPFQKICIFGLGESDLLTEVRYREISKYILESLCKMQVRDCALSIPGSSASSIDFKTKTYIFFEELLNMNNSNAAESESEWINSLMIIESPSLHKDLLSIYNSCLRNVKQPAFRNV
jgi:hypothetical protein